MSIPVICPGCHKSFKVSDKFAGKKGGCPKCKTVIQVPSLDEQVEVHEADYASGAKDSKGVSVLKPIEREEAQISFQTIGIIAGVTVVLFLLAWLIGLTFKPDNEGFQIFVLGFGAVMLAPPLVYAGYMFLRDQEALAYYQGKSLWIRTALCSTIYVLLWVAFWFIHFEIVETGRIEVLDWLYLAPPILLVGSFTAFCCFDLDMGSGFFHCSLYLLVTFLLRSTMGLGFG